MKLHLFLEGRADDPDNFVAPIRLLDPLAILARHGRVRWTVEVPERPRELYAADMIIVQRTPFASREALSEGLARLREARRRGIAILFELDDFIFCPDLPRLIEDSALDEVNDEALELTRLHREVLAVADAVMCSTENLATEMRRLLPRTPVYVVPVALDFGHPRWATGAAREPGREATIGWAGGSRVGRDLEILVPVLERVLEHCHRLRFCYVGPDKYRPLFEGLPADRIAVAPWAPYDRYPRLISTFDVALLPMQDHPYNRCKSPLKVIDFGAVGVPAIASPVAPYLAAGPWVAAFASGVDEWASEIRRRLRDGTPSGERERLRGAVREAFRFGAAAEARWTAALERTLAAAGGAKR